MLFSKPCSNNPCSADGTVILKETIYLINHIVRVRNYITGNTFYTTVAVGGRERVRGIVVMMKEVNGEVVEETRQ